MTNGSRLTSSAHRQEPIGKDFVAQLQARLGLEDETAAVASLGDWLASYEPGPAARARAVASPTPHRNAA